MNVKPPYRYKTGYIYLPLDQNTGGLNKNITLFGDIYHLKSSFHVSLLCVKNILKINPQLEGKILEIFNSYVACNSLDSVEYLPEYRVVAHADGRKSIIQMVTVKNTEGLFHVLRKELNISIDTQPTHITIYTLREEEGIGVNTQEDYENTFEIRFK